MWEGMLLQSSLKKKTKVKNKPSVSSLSSLVMVDAPGRDNMTLPLPD